MDRTLTLNGYLRRLLSFFAGAGMMAASIMTMRHFFLANYPSSIYEGAFCDISAFFNCAHGIRSTPTMIINNRMVIGTFPYEHLKAIFQALVEEREGSRKFLENWVPVPKKSLKAVK